MAEREAYVADERQIEYIATTQLHFDPDNPRFYRLDDPSSNELVIEEMLDDESAQDLMGSIGEKGYFPGEPLLVAEHPDGRLIVVEGNRRLAAVKLLNGELPPPDRRRNSIQDILDECAFPGPTELPCIRYGERKDILRYLGYRHITGVKQWDSLSKARYLAQLQTEFYDDLEQDAQMKALAKDIGSRADYVAQLLTSLSIYNVAEKESFFGLPINADDVEFSYITTAISYNKINDWLGVTGRQDINTPELSKDNLKKMVGWMFVQNEQGETVLGETRALTQLAEVVASEEALSELQENRNLKQAFLYTSGPQQALVDTLSQAKIQLDMVWSMLPKTRPLSAQHYDTAEEVFDRSKAIRNYIRDTLEDD